MVYASRLHEQPESALFSPQPIQSPATVVTAQAESPKSLTQAPAQGGTFRVSRKPASSSDRAAQKPDAQGASLKHETPAATSTGTATGAAIPESRSAKRDETDETELAQTLPPVSKGISVAGSPLTDTARIVAPASPSTGGQTLLRVSRKRREGAPVQESVVTDERQPGAAIEVRPAPQPAAVGERKGEGRAHALVLPENNQGESSASSSPPSQMVMRKARAESAQSSPQAESFNAMASHAKGIEGAVVAEGGAQNSLAKLDQQSPLPLVKAQPVSAHVRHGRSEESAAATGDVPKDKVGPSNNVGPDTRAQGRAENREATQARELPAATTGRAQGMPVSSPANSMDSERVPASGVIRRKSAGEASRGASAYDTAVSEGRAATGSPVSAALPLTSRPIRQGQTPLVVQRQVNGERAVAAPAVDVAPPVVQPEAAHAQQEARAPEIDLEKITEHVSRAIFRQLSIERERRGF